MPFRSANTSAFASRRRQLAPRGWSLRRNVNSMERNLVSMFGGVAPASCVITSNILTRKNRDFGPAGYAGPSTRDANRWSRLSMLSSRTETTGTGVDAAVLPEELVLTTPETSKVRITPTTKPEIHAATMGGLGKCMSGLSTSRRNAAPQVGAASHYVK